MASDVALASVPVPADDCCIFFPYKNYQGDSIEICHNGSTDPVKNHHFLKDYHFDDYMEAFICGRNTRMILCDEELMEDC